MFNDEQDTRQLIIDTAKRLMEETEAIDTVTVRQIAQRANVSIGLINYHFKSKNNLLSAAIGDTMTEMITAFSQSDQFVGLSPIEKLKMLLKKLCALSEKNEKLMHFTISRSIISGNMQTPLYLIPLLKELFGDQKDDFQLRILAMQLLYPIQITGLNKETFYMYSGIDVNNEAQRNRFIDHLVSNVIDEQVRS